MTPTPAPTVRIVVVTYNSRQYLDAFLTSVTQAGAIAPEVTVVDNGSEDGTLEYAAADPHLHLLETGQNLGYGAAANAGVAESCEDWVLVANPDIRFEPGSLDELFAVAYRWPKAGVLGPRIHTSDGRLYPSARELPSLGRGVGHAVFGWVWPTNPWTASYRRERGAPVEGTTGWLSGACLLLRREAFECVGGFDERYFMYFEDTDLCERVAQAGWEVVYAPSAVVEHRGGHATVNRADAMSRAHHRSAYRYLSHRYSGPGWAPVRGALRLGLYARYQLGRRISRITHGAQPTRDAPS
jgi:N-acetylglucosaminyl-diphospho-decaprenol L-rhamnosyltransferase